jgi:MSHA pilin protein MshC
LKRRAQGFTMIELITVMIVLGILSAVAIPMLTGGGNGMAGAAYRNELASGLRYAQKVAVSHRRLVCASIAANGASMTLTIAQAANASTCGTPLTSPDGTSYASRDQAITASGFALLFFQPNGTITTGGGSNAPVAAGTLAVTGQPGIRIQGATGYVE